MLVSNVIVSTQIARDVVGLSAQGMRVIAYAFAEVTAPLSCVTPTWPISSTV